MRVCIMDRLHIRLRAVGWPNSSKRVRCYQKRQSSSDRKKFSHIRSLFLLAFFDFLLTAYLLANLLAGSAAPRGGRKAVITTAQFWPFFILFGAFCQRWGDMS